MSDKSAFIDGLRKSLNNPLARSVTRQQLLAYSTASASTFPNWLVNDSRFHSGARGVYTIPEFNASGEPIVPMGTETDPESVDIEAPRTDISDSLDFLGGESLIPESLPTYVPFGHHDDIKAAINARLFFPIFVTGLSGNGKTTTIMECCAALKRECFRVNITCETDEDDLLGGFRLVDGNTQFQFGPVVHAMKRGAVLVLDEIDLASSKIMCLQPVLEGKGIYLKKVNQWVHPAPGFTIIATANTKGQGSDSGKFIGTNVLNEAFLDRFPVTMQQDYPQQATEIRILQMMADKIGWGSDPDAKDFIVKLVTWAGYTRMAFKDGASEELISTRRLLHIVASYGIWRGNRMKAIGMTTDRFSDTIKTSFMNLYKKVDETIKDDSLGFVPAGEAAVVIPDGKNPFA